MMGKLIWNGSGNLAELINSPVSLITGANLKKKPESKTQDKSSERSVNPKRKGKEKT